MPNTNTYGYPQPLDTDPVKDGALAIRNLVATIQPNAEMYSGQPALAGPAVPYADLSKIRQFYYNYQVATDASGQATVPLPFATALLTAYVMIADHAINAVTVVIRKPACTPNTLALFYRRVDGSGVASTNIQSTILAIGY
jgi:hypothetical protein